MKNKIDFFCIGAQKAATSWLYKRLDELPDFSMPYIKELHFFDRSIKYPSPNKWSRSLITRILDFDLLSNSVHELASSLYRCNFKKTRWMLKWHFSHINDDWYLSLFKNLNQITGDITPAYSILEVNDIKKMHKLSPDAKIVFIIRNPIDRSLSHLKFFHQTRDKSINELSFDEIKLFLNSKNQTLRSDYLRTLNNYSKVFSPANILVGFYDAIVNNPHAFLNDVVIFLGANKNQISSLNINDKINVSKKDIIDSEILDFVTKKYTTEIRKLSQIFGGYCSKWENELDNKKQNTELYDSVTLDKIKLRK
tara:strand:+ start:179 stop:1105 length:927 start_codon:yes stop_codon:yes gene_type:complete